MTEGLDFLRKRYDASLRENTLRDFHLSDPISFPKRYRERKDVETAALIAALFAIGPRYAILKSLEKIFGELGEAPYDAMMNFRWDRVLKNMKDHVQFAYKNITGKDVVQILYCINRTLNAHGTIQDALLGCSKGEGIDSYSILAGLLEEMKSVKLPVALGSALTARAGSLLASPKDGSACKRMNMFLRWMTRKDEIDFGLYGWLGTDKLIIPLDVNVSRAARKLGLTKRKTDNWKTAAEITNKLKLLDPADPVKYDLPLFLYGMELRRSRAN